MLSGMSVKRAILTPSAVVTLSGHFNPSFSFGSNCYAYHIAGADGKFYQKDNSAAAIQVNTGSDWIIPNSAAPGSYRIRHTSATGDTADFTPAGTINNYLSLTSAATYELVDTTVGPTTKSITYTLEIDDGTTSQDTGSYSLTADREDF